MPDVHVMHNVGQLVQSPKYVGELRDCISAAVAEELNCTGSDGAMMQMTADAVDIFLHAADSCDRMGSDLVITITAYDLPDRMKNIEYRLKQIKGRIEEDFPGIHKIAIQYIPIPNGCWVAC